MESNSTPDCVSRIVKINKKNIKVEDIDMEEVDRALDEELAVKKVEFLIQVDNELELESEHDITGDGNTTSGACTTLDGENDDDNTLINLDQTYQKSSNAKKKNRKSIKKQ